MKTLLASRHAIAVAERIRKFAMTKRILLASQYAFYPFHWEPFRLICEANNLEPSVITTVPPDLPSVHRQLGWVDVEDARLESFAPDIRVQPALGRKQRREWMNAQLEEIQPDAIWIQEEPTAPMVSTILRHYRNDSRPRIGVAVCENMFPKPAVWKRWKRERIWGRIDGLLATAWASVDSIRGAGMPDDVPAQSLVAGAQSPPEKISPIEFPFQRTSEDFVVGFAGRIEQQKGWQVLIEAIRSLPHHFKIAMAGGGDQVESLHACLRESNLSDRSAFCGLMPKADLWRFYRSVDCLAVPSLSTPKWKEQFGGVLADAMAMGLPLIGSNSGSIPEVIGPAGLIVPEGDSKLLADAILSLHAAPGIAQRFSHEGKKRFAQEFSIHAYAKKIAEFFGLTVQLNLDVAAA